MKISDLFEGMVENVEVKAITHVKNDIRPFDSVGVYRGATIERGTVLVTKVYYQPYRFPDEAAIDIDLYDDGEHIRALAAYGIFFSEKGIERYGDIEKQLKDILYDEEKVLEKIYYAATGEREEVKRIEKMIRNGIKQAYSNYQQLEER